MQTHPDMNTKIPTIVYLRVSTTEQETDSQEHQVVEYCRVRGWAEPLILRDAASGSTTNRPGLEAMLAQVRAGGVRQVVTYKLDRLGRSLTHLAMIVGELQMRNVALICTSQGIDTSKQNPVGQLQLGVLMAVAEFERALIRERTVAGLEVARKRGKRLGRPPLDPKTIELIVKTADRLGCRVRAVARELNTSPSTVCRVLAKFRNKAVSSTSYATDT
jgi:DNA invertase Pin-like site-specific DNA recombinase